MTLTANGRPPVPCGDGCGQMVEQPPTGRPRLYLDEEHRRNARRKGTGAISAVAVAVDNALRPQAGDPDELTAAADAVADAAQSLGQLRQAWHASASPAMERDLAGARRQVEDLTARLDQASRESDRAREDAQLAVRAANEERDQFTDALHAAQLDAERQDGTLQEQRERLAAAEETTAELRAATTADEARTRDLDERLGEARSHLEDLSRTAARVEDLDRLVAELRRENNSLRSDLAGTRTEVVSATTRAVEAEATNRVLEGRLETAQRRIEQLDEQTAQARQDLHDRLAEAQQRLDDDRQAAAERLAQTREDSAGLVTDLRADRDRLAILVDRLPNPSATMEPGNRAKR